MTHGRLPDSNPHPGGALLWQQYLSAEAQGQRARALSALRKFVEALQNAPEERRYQFAEMFCRQMADVGDALPLREPLFAGIIGPYLVSAHQQGVEDAGRWLAFFHPHFLNMPPSQRLVDLVDAMSPIALLTEAFRRNPDNVQTQDLLIQKLAQQFEYAVHEVPSGVLYAADGATVAECREWEGDLMLFREVVRRRRVAEKYETAIRSWGFHFHGYADYLTHREQYRDYAQHIERHQEA